MGNYKFRLSDMMPNAWFYKLKNGSSHHHHHPVKNNNINNKQKNLQHHHYFITTPPSSATPPPLQYHQTTQISHPRHSYYFNREPYSTKIIDTNDHHHHQVLHTIQNSSPTNPKVSDLSYIEQPRKSSKRSRPKSRRRTVNKQSVSSISSSSKSDYSAAASREECAESATVDRNSMSMSVSSSSCSCRVSASTTDIIIDIIDGKKSSSSSSSAEKFDGFDPITELELPPIITKAPSKLSQMNKKKSEEQRSSRRRKSVSSKEFVHGGSLSLKEKQKSSPFVRKSISPGSPGGLKLRSNSPRFLTRKLHSNKDMTLMTKKPNKQRTTTTTAGAKKHPTVTAAAAKISSCSIPISSMNKNVADSFAVIKSSFDPQRDFRESMVEMIVENNLRKSGDLEELLACYLSLNSNEYHDLIVKVFEQIWFDLTDIHSVSNSCSTSSIV